MKLIDEQQINHNHFRLFDAITSKMVTLVPEISEKLNKIKSYNTKISLSDQEMEQDRQDRLEDNDHIFEVLSNIDEFDR